MSPKFERSFEALDDVFGLTDRFFHEHEIDGSTAFALKLAIEEIFTNFVKYNPEGDGGISVELQMGDDDIVVTLVDEDAPEFDVTEYDKADTTSALDARTAGGLGIYLVKKMVDDVRYHHQDRTSTVVLTKKLNR